MPTALIIVLAVVGGLALLAGFFVLVLKRVTAEGERRTAERYGDGADVLRKELAANYFGRTSAGLGEVRGNGALVLARHELWFSRFMPKDEIVIPLADILEVDDTRTHKKRTVGQRLLRVRFTVPDGEDCIAWAVRDVDGWKRDIEHARSG